MKQIYAAAGLSKQGHSQWLARATHRQSDELEVVTQIRRLRIEHPRMGLRKLHSLYQPAGGRALGRDRFIAVGVNAALSLPRALNRQRTTYAVHSEYPNHLIGRALTNVNQVWVSDITYYHVGNRFSYITLLMDLYSRKILGACAEQSMHAHWSVAVLAQALADRQITGDSHVIHHSDCGSQYMSKDYLALLQRYGVSVSTCEIVYENAHAERINGIIKQEYLDAWRIDSHEMLQQALARAVGSYNHSRPHGSLGRRSPIAFEEMLGRTPIAEHPPMPIWPQQPLVRIINGVDLPYIAAR